MNPPEEPNPPDTQRIWEEQRQAMLREFPALAQPDSPESQTFACAFAMVGNDPAKALAVARAVLVSEEVAQRHQIISAELRRLYPAVCVEGSPERAAFLREWAAEGWDNNPEHALLVAFIVLNEEHPDIPRPHSPLLHPCTVLEQLCFVRFWNLEYRDTTAEDAFAYLEKAAQELGGKLREYGGDDEGKESLRIRFLVPRQILTTNRVSVSFRKTPLASALRFVAETIGLTTRMLDGEVVVCSDEVGEALDANQRYGFQAPLWELRNHRTIGVPILDESTDRELERLYPKISATGSPEQTQFLAHLFLYGTAETAWSMADRLFLCSPPAAQGTHAPALPPAIPSLDDEPGTTSEAE